MPAAGRVLGVGSPPPQTGHRDGAYRGKPVRIFPISYGQGADKATLKRIAEATNSALYDATNPATIDAVFTAVVSNF